MFNFWSLCSLLLKCIPPHSLTSTSTRNRRNWSKQSRLAGMSHSSKYMFNCTILSYSYLPVLTQSSVSHSWGAIIVRSGREALKKFAESLYWQPRLARLISYTNNKCLKAQKQEYIALSLTIKQKYKNDYLSVTSFRRGHIHICCLSL